MPPALAERLMALLEQPLEVRLRGLVSLCRQLSQQAQGAPETCLARSWWRIFNQAGVGLREALDQARAEGYPRLSDRELEQAYFLLIHVAYFFAPGGIAESVWPLLPAEPEDQPGELPARDALGVTFAAPPHRPAGAQMRQQVRRCFQRLGQMLGRSDGRAKGSAELLACAAQSLPPLDEESTAVSPGNKGAC